MAKFTAHYITPPACKNKASGLFDFESNNRLKSKSLYSDARIAMLKRFGSQSVVWTIDSIQHKKRYKGQADGQLTLDFRETPNKRAKRLFKRGW